MAYMNHLRIFLFHRLSLEKLFVVVVVVPTRVRPFFCTRARYASNVAYVPLFFSLNSSDFLFANSSKGARGFFFPFLSLFLLRCIVCISKG